MPMSDDFKARLFPRLPRIIKDFGTPFHIYDEHGIRKTARRMKHAFACRWKNSYAVKALPNPAILEIVREEGMGFDCSSIAELLLSRHVGASGGDIMFTSNDTSQEEFQAALRDGGCILNLDDVSLISKVPRPFPKTICFRINPGNAAVTGDNVIGKPINAKYGITLKQVVPAYRQAMKYGAERFGLHTMLCSNDRKASNMVATVEMLLGLCVLLKNELGIKCEFINMGGGFGIPYVPGQRELALEWMGEQIVHRLERFELTHGWMPFLMSECGRYVTGPHGVLVSRVINEKRIYKRYLGTDTSMSALMRPGMYSQKPYRKNSGYHHVTILNKKGEVRGGPRERMSVVGPICENCDRQATDRLLPRYSRVGDIVVTHDTGAHGIAMCFNYNGRLRPQELLMRHDGSVVRIRRAETVDDLFRTIIDCFGDSMPKFNV